MTRERAQTRALSHRVLFGEHTIALSHNSSNRAYFDEVFSSASPAPKRPRPRWCQFPDKNLTGRFPDPRSGRKEILVRPAVFVVSVAPGIVGIRHAHAKTAMKATTIKARTRRRIHLVLNCISFACLGYAIRIFQPTIWRSSSEDEARNSAPLACESSFSEVKNLKTSLAGLADQFMLDAYSYSGARRDRSGSTVGDIQARTATRAAYIRYLEDGIAEFEGTDEELRITERLLAALKGAKIYDKWLDTYLNALYRHPMEPVIGRSASAAAHLGNTLGRQQAVREAFSWVTSMPLKCGAKTEVEMAMHELMPEARSERPVACD